MRRRCVFFDRDGVFNLRPPPHEYVRSWQEFVLIPAVVDWVRLCNALDLLVIVVTNQQGVAHGKMSLAVVNDIHQRMRDLLSSQGARIDDILVCPHANGTCDCRKPLPGLVYQARDKWNIDLGASLMVGDSASDEELAERCGMRFLSVSLEAPPAAPADQVKQAGKVPGSGSQTRRPVIVEQRLQFTPD